MRQSWYRCLIQLTIRQLLTVMALLFLSWENQWQFWRMTASWHIFNLCDKVVVKRRGWIKLSMTSNVICVVWVLKLVCEWETSSCCWIDLQCWLAAAAEICFSVDKFSHPFSFCAALQYRRVKRGFRWTECGRVDKIKGRYRSWLVYIEQLLFFDWNCLTIVNWGKKYAHKYVFLSVVLCVKFHEFYELTLALLHACLFLSPEVEIIPYNFSVIPFSSFLFHNCLANTCCCC